MKPAWESYMRKILWRYPKNHPRENAAIEKAIKSGVPEIVRLVSLTRSMSLEEAAQHLGISQQAASDIQFGFLEKIAKNLNLPTEDEP